MDLREAQRRVDAWISRFEEGYWPPLSNLARLTEEVGELARLLNHRFGHKPKKPDEPHQELDLELADILFVLLVIANEQGIDLNAALERTLDKYRTRDGERWTLRDPADRTDPADRKDRTERPQRAGPHQPTDASRSDGT